MNQKGFANLIVISIVVALVLSIGGYFVLVRKPATPSETQQPITPSGSTTVTLTPPPDTSIKTAPPSKPPTDVFLQKINDLIARGIGQIVECKGESVQYFYWGNGTALPASVMRKEGNQPWEARPGIPNRSAGSPIKEAGVNDLGVNPQNCNEVYVVTQWAEAYKSKNGGKTWEAINLGGTSYSSVGWGIVAINPKNVRHVVIGTAFPIHSELTRYRIYQSQDGGQSFYPVELVREFTQPPTRTEISNLLF